MESVWRHIVSGGFNKYMRIVVRVKPELQIIRQYDCYYFKLLPFVVESKQTECGLDFTDILGANVVYLRIASALSAHYQEITGQVRSFGPFDLVLRLDQPALTLQPVGKDFIASQVENAKSSAQNYCSHYQRYKPKRGLE